MKILILALLLISSPSFSQDRISLESRLTELSFARNEDFQSLIVEFIAIGQFRTGYPYSPVHADEETIQSFVECVDSDFSVMYDTYGYDTQIGILFIGCAYKLDWLH